MVEEISRQAAEAMVQKLEHEIGVALDVLLEGKWTLEDVKANCTLVRVAGVSHETLYYKDTPLLEIYPVQYEQRMEGDRAVLRLTRKIRPLLAGGNDGE